MKETFNYTIEAMKLIGDFMEQNNCSRKEATERLYALDEIPGFVEWVNEVKRILERTQDQ